jgi:hypothetical protein
MVSRLLAAVLVLAAFVRLDGLGSPHTYVADEGFYARDGCSYVLHSQRTCDVSGDTTPEHPPLGNRLIGLRCGAIAAPISTRSICRLGRAAAGMGRLLRGRPQHGWCWV